MNLNLSFLSRTLGDAEAAIEMVMLVQAVSTNTATRDERNKFDRLPASHVRVCMRIIRDFSSIEGKFNIDHIAWQLGVDTTAEGPRIPDDHNCDDTTMIYDAHIAAPGFGVATHCGVCSKQFVKIQNTYYPANEYVPELTPEQVR